MGALTKAPFHLSNPLMSEDTKSTLDALYALGAEFTSRSKGLLIHCEEFRKAPGTIDAGNSGTTIRLMAGVGALLPFKTVLTGDQSLIRRPMSPLIDALNQLGAKCEYLGRRGLPPFSVEGPMTKSKCEVEADVSSQFISSLLIACSQKESDTSIRLVGEMRSRPYVDVTIQMLKDFGAQVEDTGDSLNVSGGQKLKRDEYTIPGDFSSASFPLAAAAITGGEVTVRNLEMESPQGDRSIIDHLSAFGASVTVCKDSVRVVGGSLRGTEIDVRHTPDLFPILAVIGAVSQGRTVLSGGEHLRDKESNRIATTTAFLRSMGANITPKSDGCEIVGVDKLQGAIVDTQGDHRILMAAAVAGLVSSSDVRIRDDDSFNVSYPGFIRDMHQLGCRIEVRK